MTLKEKNMNKLIKTVLSLILSAALLISTGAAFPAFAETPDSEDPASPVLNPMVTDVIITNYKDGSIVREITTVTNFNVTLTISDTGIRQKDFIKEGTDTKQNFIDNLIITKPRDSFSGTVGSNISVLSFTDDRPTDNAPVVFTIEFLNCKWDGTSNEFGFMLGYGILGRDMTTISVPIKQCRTSTGDDDPEDIIPEPLFKISAKEPANPIKAGDEGTFDLVLKNLGTADAERILVEISSSEDILITESSSVQDVDYVFSGDTVTLTVHYMALNKINSSKQSFNVSVKYYYENGLNEMTGTSSAIINVQAIISTVEKVYPVVLSQFDLAEKELKPNTAYNGTVTLKNIGTADMKGIFVTFSAGESFILTDNTTSCYIPSIEQGKSIKVPVKIKTLTEITALKQDLGMSLKYLYDMGSDELDGSYENTFTMFAPIDGKTAPKPHVTLKSLEEPIRSGKHYKYYINIENKGEINMEDVKLTVKGSDGLILIRGTDSAAFDIIKSGKKKQAPVEFKTAAKLESPNQYFTVEMTYTYTTPNGKENVGELSTVLSLDATVSNAPVVRLYGENRNFTLLPDTDYEYTVTVRNFGDVTIRDLYIDFTASDSLYFLERTEYAYIESIKAGKSADVTLKFHTTKEISGIKQVINAAIVYCYGAATSTSTAEAQGTITLIAANVTDGGSGAPNIIISSYDMGAEQIAAGDSFNLDFDFFNTSSDTDIENIVVTVNAGGDLSIFGGANTFFYPSLYAAGAIHESIALRALATAQTGTSQVGISFKYDYLEDGKRNTTTCEQTIFIPVYQPDKMSFDVKTPAGSVFAGTEAYITISYMNKGRCDISNVKAEIVGDVAALSTSKVIGNVAPGANSTFDFIVTPYMGGECSFSILFTYDDANMNEVIREIPVSFFVEEMAWEEPIFPEDPGMIEEPTNEGGFPWIIVWIAAGVVVIGTVIAIVCAVRHKNKKKKLTEDDIDWEDDVFDDTTKV